MYDYYLYSPRADYGIKPVFSNISRIPPTGFTSLYAVTKETAEALTTEGSTRWFKGVVWSEKLWLDFDSYEAADRAERSLIEKGLAYVAYDSGGRGAHFGVPRSCSPSHLLPLRDKQWVRTHFPGADHSIYTHLHPFRLPGTVHEKTGRRKELVCNREGSVLTLPPFKFEELQASEIGASSGITSIFDCVRIMTRTVPVKNGARHANMISLVYSLKETGYDKFIAEFWVNEWNKLLSEPKELEEIEKAIRSIYG